MIFHFHTIKNKRRLMCDFHQQQKTTKPNNQLTLFRILEFKWPILDLPLHCYIANNSLKYAQVVHEC